MVDTSEKGRNLDDLAPERRDPAEMDASALDDGTAHATSVDVEEEAIGVVRAAEEEHEKEAIFRLIDELTQISILRVKEQLVGYRQGPKPDNKIDTAAAEIYVKKYEEMAQRLRQYCDEKVPGKKIDYVPHFTLEYKKGCFTVYNTGFEFFKVSLSDDEAPALSYANILRFKLSEPYSEMHEDYNAVESNPKLLPTVEKLRVLRTFSTLARDILMKEAVPPTQLQRYIWKVFGFDK